MSHIDNIGYLLQHLAFALARQNDQVLQERLGIGFSQFKILMVLERNPYVQQRDIAAALGQTEASVSRQIKLMVESGLLVSRVSPSNRRRHITTPTSKGLRLNEESLKILNSYHQPMFDKLSDKQKQQFLDTMTIMHDHACHPGSGGEHFHN